jgi:hypothetical protein
MEPSHQAPQNVPLAAFSAGGASMQRSHKLPTSLEASTLPKVHHDECAVPRVAQLWDVWHTSSAEHGTPNCCGRCTTTAIDQAVDQKDCVLLVVGTTLGVYIPNTPSPNSTPATPSISKPYTCDYRIGTAALAACTQYA